MHDHDDASSRRAFILGGSAALVGLTGFTTFRPATAQQKGCPTGNVGPINCSPPAGYNNPVKWSPDPSLPMRTRYSAFDPAGATSRAKLQRAYAALRQLTRTNPNDPRGWMAQANVHCWYCGGGQNGMAGPEIHGGWWFFPWHRCYLYFHERALQSVLKDPTVALSYWDWDTVTTTNVLGVPPAFYTGALNDPTREALVSDRMQKRYVAGLSPADPHLLQTDTAHWFGADPSNDSSQQNGGQLEMGPHGIVHLWTAAAHESGLCTNSPPGGRPNMGVLATAAQDPVFYAHHCNIDRLWDVWLDYQKAHNTGEGNPNWSAQSWSFYDSNLDGTGQWVSMSVSDVIDHAATLKYQYAAPAQAPVLVAAAAPPTQQQQGTVVNNRPVTQSVQVPQEVRSSLEAVNRAKQQAGNLVLHIEFEISANDGALVHVYGNLPNATRLTSIEHPNFLGYFTVVPKGGREHTMPRKVVIDVTNKLHAIASGDTPVAITLVPMYGTGQNSSRLRVTRIYLARQD